MVKGVVPPSGQPSGATGRGAVVRVPLPHRRPSVTVDCRWQGHLVLVTVGFDLSGAPREVFAGVGSGGALEATLADACVLVSIALQHGITPEALERSLGRMPLPGAPEGVSVPSSPVGVIFEAIREARP